MMNTFTQGSIHQGSELFSEHSRRRQCAYMVLSCFLTFEVSSQQLCTPECVDQILIRGDSMYLHTLMNNLIPDTSTLLVEHLPIMANLADGSSLICSFSFKGLHVGNCER